MKKILFALTILGVAAVVFGLAGYAYAQTQTPPAPSEYGPGMMGGGYGRSGMMGQSGSGMMGQGFGHGMMGNSNEMTALHAYMYPAIATALGLTPEEFDARHTAGETFWEIAEAQGLTTEEAWTLMQTARETALQQAVTDGVITQEFATWMLEHMETMHDEGYGPGSGHCNQGG